MILYYPRLDSKLLTEKIEYALIFHAAHHEAQDDALVTPPLRPVLNPNRLSDQVSDIRRSRLPRPQSEGQLHSQFVLMRLSNSGFRLFALFFG